MPERAALTVVNWSSPASKPVKTNANRNKWLINGLKCFVGQIINQHPIDQSV